MNLDNRSKMFVKLAAFILVGELEEAWTWLNSIPHNVTDEQMARLLEGVGDEPAM